MFLSEVIPAEVVDFWTPISQIVPVFALALVLEVRSAVRKWSVGNRLLRYTQAILYASVAVMLVSIENKALDLMLRGEDDPLAAAFTLNGMGLVFAILCVSPVINIAVAASGELLLFASRVLPGSSWRKLRKKLRQSLSEGKEAAAITLEALGAVQEAIVLSKEAIRLIEEARAKNSEITVLEGKLAELARKNGLQPPTKRPPDKDEILTDGYLDASKNHLRALKKSKRGVVKRSLRMAEILESIEQTEVETRLFSISEFDERTVQGMLSDYQESFTSGAAPAINDQNTSNEQSKTVSNH